MSVSKEQRCSTLIKSNRWRLLSYGILLILPKCSLCLFALTSSIVICGLENPAVPEWEYLLLVSVCLPLLMIHKNDCKENTWISYLFLVSGVACIIVYMIWPFTQSFSYSMGLSFLGIGVLRPFFTRVWQQRLSCIFRGHFFQSKLKQWMDKAYANSLRLISGMMGWNKTSKKLIPFKSISHVK